MSVEGLTSTARSSLAIRMARISHTWTFTVALLFLLLSLTGFSISRVDDSIRLIVVRRGEMLLSVGQELSTKALGPANEELRCGHDRQKMRQRTFPS